jgi:hypothetical protein
MRAITLFPSLALLASSGCASDPSIPTPQTTPLFVYTTFANPNVTVRVNGQVLGTLTKQATATGDCTQLTQGVAAGAVLTFTARLGQQYAITWDYGGGKTGSDQLDATADVIASECLIEPIDPPQ